MVYCDCLNKAGITYKERNRNFDFETVSWAQWKTEGLVACQLFLNLRRSFFSARLPPPWQQRREVVDPPPLRKSPIGFSSVMQWCGGWRVLHHIAAGPSVLAGREFRMCKALGGVFLVTNLVICSFF
ncbi:hypothetical protein CDAR_29751 [Caerostris darwini]|uniref:Uncharacterized protein n=1 Tax=Caerostris darwini TaxID=1538125 RepID=A0AAV4QVX1_9ARAC|nr:hypothetical protein CDAR_29751 [Caerostris darwini]